MSKPYKQQGAAVPAAVIPAQLSYLAIYNPSLGPTDETVQDQIVYYYNRKTRLKRRRHKNIDDHDAREAADVAAAEARNEKLRQVGLAQGMVQFARSVSNEGEAVDSVETEKSRIVLRELESGWWILACIDLTRLLLSPSDATSSPSSSSKDPQKAESTQQPSYKYSAREVSPPALLSRQLQHAHSIFQLHHGLSLEEVYNRLGRVKFCAALDRFWSRFIRTWDVLLHGNPSVEIFGGIKLAAGGELGIGVGEEEWGSGEREVLEGFVKSVDGLVDVVVSRFGMEDSNAEVTSTAATSTASEQPFLSKGSESTILPTDGVIFSGTGAVHKTSLKSIAGWMEWIYLCGDNAYGVADNPSSALRKRQRDVQSRTTRGAFEPQRRDSHAKAAERRSSRPRAKDVGSGAQPNGSDQTPTETALREGQPAATDQGKVSVADSLPEDASSVPGTTKLMKYLTLGYSSSWGKSTTSPSRNELGPSPDKHHTDHLEKYPPEKPEERPSQSRRPQGGQFLIGLSGDLDDDHCGRGGNGDADSRSNVSGEDSDAGEQHGRIMLRTVYVQLAHPNPSDSQTLRARSYEALQRIEPSAMSSLLDEAPYKQCTNLRVVVYKRTPFIYSFLFAIQTPSLAIPTFYRTLHHQLKPLHIPLLSSTSPTKVVERINATSASSPTVPGPYPGRGTASPSTSHKHAPDPAPIYDLIFDPKTLTIHSSIPNIPDPVLPTASTATATASSSAPPWTRPDALNVHTQLLNTYISTRRRPGELEQTCKTSRGWWVVWMRLPRSEALPDSASSAGAIDFSERTLGRPDEGAEASQRRRRRRHDDDDNARREAFLVRRASDYSPAGAPSGSSSLRGRPRNREAAGAGTLSMATFMGIGLGGLGLGGGGGGGGSGDAGGDGGAGNPARLVDGIGVDAKRYVETLLSLGR